MTFSFLFPISKRDRINRGNIFFGQVVEITVETMTVCASTVICLACRLAAGVALRFQSR